MLKVMTIVGTRPELIKMSRVIAEFDRHTKHVLVHTGQNYDLRTEPSVLRRPGDTQAGSLSGSGGRERCSDHRPRDRKVGCGDGVRATRCDHALRRYQLLSGGHLLPSAARYRCSTWKQATAASTSACRKS